MLGAVVLVAMSLGACGTGDAADTAAEPSASSTARTSTLHPALDAQVAVSQLAGVGSRSQPDGPVVDVVAQADAVPNGPRLAAFLSDEQRCIALVKPAPGLTVCEPSGLQPTEMVATGTSGPSEGGTGSKSLFFGYAPSGTTSGVVEAAGTTRALDLYLSPEAHGRRVFFLTEMPVPADRRLVFRGYDEGGQETSAKTLG